MKAVQVGLLDKLLGCDQIESVQNVKAIAQAASNLAGITTPCTALCTQRYAGPLH